MPLPSFENFGRRRLEGGPRTLVSVTPLTGRTHQIRRCVYRLTMPVMGDAQHGESKVNRYWRETAGLDSLALHCLAIERVGDDDDDDDSLL